MGKLFRTTLISAVVAASYMGAGCQPNAQLNSPKGATTPKRNLAQTGKDPIPVTPLESTGPTTAPSVTPGSTPPVPSTPPISPSASPTPIPSINPGTPALLGLVTGPASIVANNGGTLLSNNGSGLLSNNGSSLIANNGGGLIANNSGSLIANNGGGLLSNNGSSYHLLAAGGLSPAPLSNAFLYLTNRDEKFYFNSQTNQVFGATSDSTGKYLFPITGDNGFPVDKDVVVNVMLNDSQRLTGFVVPTAGSNDFQVDIATTLATELLRGDAYRTGKKLSEYDITQFKAAVDLTRQALASGDLPATAPIKTAAGTKTVSAFNLQMQSVDILRNEYVLVLSAAKKANTLVKQLSDKWKTILGYRPAGITTFVGNGNYPKVTLAPYPPDVEGDHRNGKTTPLLQVPLGQVRDVAVSSRGDYFITTDGSDLSDAHIRWIKPNGTVSSLWLPDFNLRDARGIVIEKEPTDDPNNPGSVLVAGGSVSLLWRVHIVDTELKNGDGSPKFPMEIVSGLFLDSLGDAAHPLAVDGEAAYPEENADTPKNSYYRLIEEGERKYLTTQQPVPNPARYAHLDGLIDVAVDELGNIYMCESRHHRIRMIPKVDGSYFGYRKPLDANNDGIVDGFGEPTPMKAGALYTIAGNPSWDTVKTPASTTGRWFGEYGGDNGPAQAAKFDSPNSLVFRGGALYVTDTDNQRVRKIDRTTGTVTTVAGAPSGTQANTTTSYYYEPGHTGDGGPATAAKLGYPKGLAIDASGRLFIGETGYGRIRMVDSDGTIKTVAGRVRTTTDDGTSNTGDGSALHWADLLGLDGMAFDPEGNLVFTDEKQFRLRRLWRQWE